MNFLLIIGLGIYILGVLAFSAMIFGGGTHFIKKEGVVKTLGIIIFWPLMFIYINLTSK